LDALELEGTSKLGVAGDVVVVTGGGDAPPSVAPPSAMAIASLLQIKHDVIR
jgi:hypothetical protein